MFTCCDCGKDLYDRATVKLLTKENSKDLPIFVCTDCCSSTYRFRSRWSGTYGEIRVINKRLMFKKFPIWKLLYYWFMINIKHKKVG